MSVRIRRVGAEIRRKVGVGLENMQVRGLEERWVLD